jgi:hypothetical protein
MRKKEAVKTLDELKALLVNDLAELDHLEQWWSLTIVERSVREQEIGRHCYEAEEHLYPGELTILKRALALSETEWWAYKAKFIAGCSPGGMA